MNSIDDTFNDFKFGKNINYEESDVQIIFDESSPSDFITLSKSNLLNLNNIFANMGLEVFDCPSDIIKSNTIPLRDFILKIENKDERLYGPDYIRFVYKESNQDIFMLYSFNSLKTRADYTDVMKVGFCDNRSGLFVDTSIVWRNKAVREFFSYYSMQTTKEEYEKYIIEVISERQNYLSIWYIIQVLLLNPDIKKTDLLQKQGREKIPEVIFGKQIQNKRKRKTKYMKRLYFNSDFFGTRKEFERHTLCWYVIGHYRKHGESKVWVNGYWKGPMRHAKKNLDEGRERIINCG